MIKVNIPERITEPSIISLINSKVPTKLSLDEIRGFDFAGRENFNEGHYEEALCNKLIAAILYGQRYKHVMDIFDAAMCYNKAAGAAYKIGFRTVDFRCAIRSARLHHKNLTVFEFEKSRSGLVYARKNIWNHFKGEGKLITSVYSDNHIWFPQLRQDAS